MSDTERASAAAVVVVGLDEIGERLAQLRLCEPPALESMCRSLSRHGQLSPVVVLPAEERLELVDGFKRLRAARALGWRELSTTTRATSFVEAKVHMMTLHDQRGLTELEEAWVIRSLHRDDGLSQPEIARRLERHKSWVWRRLLLVEALDPAVQADVRLGLIVPRAAVALAGLPRGNQTQAAAVVVRRGLTVQQTALFVAAAIEQPDEGRAAWIARRLDEGPAEPGPRPRRAIRSEADWMAADVTTLLRVAARLEARLLGTPLTALGASAAELVAGGLVTLTPVLTTLLRTIDTSTTGRGA